VGELLDVRLGPVARAEPSPVEDNRQQAQSEDGFAGDLFAGPPNSILQILVELLARPSRHHEKRGEIVGPRSTTGLFHVENCNPAVVPNQDVREVEVPMNEVTTRKAARTRCRRDATAYGEELGRCRSRVAKR